MPRRARKGPLKGIKLLPMSDDALGIAQSYSFLARDLSLFLLDERLDGQTLSRSFVVEQQAYASNMAASWTELARRMGAVDL